jgi:hypothetical protein
MRFHIAGIKPLYSSRIVEIDTGLLHIVSANVAEAMVMRLINIEPKSIGFVALA